MPDDAKQSRSRPSARDRAEATDHTARAIITAEAEARLKKTEKLKALRMEREADAPPVEKQPAGRRKRPA